MINKEIYDVYYSTGGGDLVYGGADLWVNHWIENVAPKLKVKPVLAIHRKAPTKPLSLEQKRAFKSSVKKGTGGNEGRKINVSLRKNFKKSLEKRDKVYTELEKTKSWKEVVKEDLQVIYQPDDVDKFREVLRGARRINILHGYYTNNPDFIEMKDKIFSNVVHVCIENTFKAHTIIETESQMTFGMDKEWENEINSYAKHPIWIGFSKTPLHDKFNMKDITNFYEFKHNLDVSDDNTIGFAARVEARKCVHYLTDLKSEICTRTDDLFWYRKNLNMTFPKSKVFKYSNDTIELFYKKKWGVAHVAHLLEPFGYGIFQALDFGKIPIIASDWLPEYNYPFRCHDKRGFEKCYKEICELTIEEKRKYVFDFRDYLRKYDNKKRWAKKFIDLYNS